MKYFIYLLITIATGLIIYNITYLDFDNLLIGDSKTALIGIFSSACVVMLMTILLVSRNIQKKKRGN
ncbi:phosphate starvation-inducible membrane PsiE [Aquimarina sp. EL_43]|uniref:hypothetical protein n=1 Tax=Aquimarina TaxID=290174 RepID=UPI0004703CF1|nr:MULTISPECIES: hypothetical protein [Aquimarina]MBG6133219.1 phosphate starvation-inducible membrane PsiE [Aquimarina sp. EL_35]MBG6153422.1 phosphate starvation-inducible membrane PsiE [Aquimarina sp. EL_32]MBG6171533.1 phosphate starvation-inducible membrane PsiE [Aquimarina sp. EL_43]